MTKKQTEEILVMLEDDANYYGEYGRQFLSNSNIKTLLNDPLNFGNPTEPHLNLVKGQYFHNMILEPEKIDSFPIIEASSRNTNIYREAAAGEICLLSKERDELEHLGEIMLRNPTAHDLIRDVDVEYEVPGVVNLAGEWWKLKADIVNRTQGFVVDIKTTGDIDKFESSAWTYNYDSQAYIYSEYFGLDFVFVIMCKKSKRLGIFDCSPEFIARGKQKVSNAVEAYRKFTDVSFDPDAYFMAKTL